LSYRLWINNLCNWYSVVIWHRPLKYNPLSRLVNTSSWEIAKAASRLSWKLIASQLVNKNYVQNIQLIDPVLYLMDPGHIFTSCLPTIHFNIIL
jgi:hypothetical protein